MNIYQTQLSQVRQWMTDMNQVCPKDFVDSSDAVAELRYKLIDEEYKEWQQASPMSNDLLDSLADLLYVTYGSFAHLGIKIDGMADYTPLPLTGRKISIDAYVAMAFAALRKRPLCRFTLESHLTKLILSLHQAAAANGYDVDQAFDIVHKSNYTKFWTAEEVKSMGISPDLTSYKPALNKYVVFNQSGKVTKPPSFTPPNLQPVVIAALRLFERGTSPASLPAASTKTTAPAADPAPKQPAQPLRHVVSQQSRSRMAIRSKAA